MIRTEMPKILKANLIKGKNLILRNPTISDAEFIISLRTDSEKSLYLSPTSSDLVKQIAWLENYSKESDQAYFIIENHNAEPLGTVRLYDAKDESFCWGSWILKNGAHQTAAIESALIVYAYAIDHLGFQKSHFSVRRENEKVWKFHERFGAKRVGETPIDFLYEISMENILNTSNRYRKYLPNAIEVEW